MYRGVYRHSAAPQTEYQRLLAAVWAGGAAALASHRAAAWLWGLFGRFLEVVEITVTRGRGHTIDHRVPGHQDSPGEDSLPEPGEGAMNDEQQVAALREEIRQAMVRAAAATSALAST